MKKWIFLLLLLLIVPILVGCPGNRGIDVEANEKLWAWVEEQDVNGWTITGWPDTHYTEVILDHEFKPTKVKIAIFGEKVNNLHQRNMMEDIARAWRNQYAANMRPRFNLRVEFFNKEINRESELGWTEIDEDGNVDTHHSATLDVM